MEGRSKGSAYKMKGSPMQRNFGIGSPLHDEKNKSVSEKQTIVDKKSIEENTNQPIKGSTTGDYKETVKSVKRQNRVDASNLSRKEVKKKLKSRSEQGSNKSEKQNTSWWKRTFGSTKNLQSDLAHQQNVSDVDIKGKPQ